MLSAPLSSCDTLGSLSTCSVSPFPYLHSCVFEQWLRSNGLYSGEHAWRGTQGTVRAGGRHQLEEEDWLGCQTVWGGGRATYLPLWPTPCTAWLWSGSEETEWH